MELFNSEGLLLSVLWGIGYGVKHKTRIPNTYIPFILLTVASVLKYAEDSLAGLIFGEAPTLSTLFWAIAYGIQYTFFACGGYEAVRAARFNWQERRKRRRKMDLRKKDSFLFLMAFLEASALFSAVALILGCGWFGTFSKITDGWIFGMWFIIALDSLRKALREREKITPTYIAMLCLLSINVISFSYAAITTNRMFSSIGLAVSVFTGVTAGVLPLIVNAVKAKRGGDNTDGKAIDEASLQNEWSKYRTKVMRLPAERRAQALERFLAFHLMGDNIYCGLDFTRPLIEGVDENNDKVALTVHAAEENKEALVIAEDAVGKARAYVAGLLA